MREFLYPTGGNRCGHDPSHFRRFVPPEHHHPKILEEARSRIGDCIGAFWDDLLKGPRQKRSERREALGILLSCLVHRVDLATLRVGIPMKGGDFRAYTDQELARMTGLGIRRLERAMQDLVEIGFIQIKKRCQKRVEGPYRGIAAIRTISIRLFELMGLGKRLRKERKKASERSTLRQLEVLSLETFKLIQQTLQGDLKPIVKTREDHLQDLSKLRTILARP